MILFYSITCQHCAVLLDTINRHDTKKTIKLVCIDNIVNLIKKRITNVPALMFLPNKEIIYGKAVFDYLLLPNRGYLFVNNTTREKEKTPSSINSPIPLNINNTELNEPMSFSLGRITNDTFSDINDNDFNSINLDNNKNYIWELIDNNNSTNMNNQQNQIGQLANNYKNEKKLPSLEELTKERENLFKDIK